MLTQFAIDEMGGELERLTTPDGVTHIRRAFSEDNDASENVLTKHVALMRSLWTLGTENNDLWNWYHYETSEAYRQRIGLRVVPQYRSEPFSGQFCISVYTADELDRTR